MRRTIIMLLVPFLCGTAFGADEAKSLFDTLFGPRMKQVKATLDRADDLALAAEIHKAAVVLDRPDSVSYFCDQIIELTQRQNEGLPLAIEAAELLADKCESRRAEAHKKLGELLLRQAAVGSAEARQQAGERLIALQLQLGDDAYAAGDFDGAAGQYRQALAMAQRTKSASLDTARAKLESAGHRTRVLRQIARLQERLLANAQDGATADELIRAFMIDMNSPKEAVKYLDRAKDATLKKIVPLAARPIHEASAGDAYLLGQWYSEAAGSAAAAAKENMNRNAAACFARFLDSNPTDNLARATATLLLKKARDALPAFTADPPATPVRSETPDPRDRKVDEAWISKDASYRVSSQHPGMPPRSSLLTGGEELMMNQFAFHTDKAKANNSVIIDLGKVKTITSLWIENRRTICQDRAIGMTLALTQAAEEQEKVIWTAEKIANEWTIKLDRPTRARFVILRLNQESFGFHLAQVKVFGQE